MAQIATTGARAELSSNLRARSPWFQVLWRITRNPLAFAGLIVVIAFFGVALFANFLAPYPYDKQNLDYIEKAPTLAHWAGTDSLGRDMLSRLIFGARSSAFVVLLVTTVNILLGVPFGAIAGYFGGWVDNLIMRITEILFAFPGLLFTFLIAATIRAPVLEWARANGFRDLANSGYLDYAVVIIALGAIGWAGLARFVRGQVLSTKEREYVISAQAAGVPTWRVIARHILPNALAPIIVSLSMGMGFIALSEGYLSFLGIGLQPPNPSWGNIMAENAGRYWRRYPEMVWLVFIPGALFALIVLAFSFLGDGLNEALNPEID
ncbi:Dipeptide transport system permease protein DppC [Anaerolineae bacterium]|nr:Dipeptide transport system permease protein DppC [Anaerolineae bacterium]